MTHVTHIAMHGAMLAALAAIAACEDSAQTAEDRSRTPIALDPRWTAGRVAIPLLGEARTIAMDGHIVWRSGEATGRIPSHQESDRLVFEDITGEHTFAWSR